jgi:HAMP domain-containing protein
VKERTVFVTAYLFILAVGIAGWFIEMELVRILDEVQSVRREVEAMK